jgi:hypothetical protein
MQGVGVSRVSQRLEQAYNVTWRTLTAFVPCLAHPDDAYAKGLLSDAEYRLYMRMDVRDRAHGYAVARRLVARYPDASLELRRAALLHDVGKLGARYNPLLRILVALYTPQSIVPAPRLRGLRGAWQLKRHHDSYGEALIRASGGEARVAEIVGRHHHAGSDGEAARLQETDACF